MKAKVYLIINSDAIEKAESIGMPEPDREEGLFDFYFRLIDVTGLWRHSRTRIIVYILGDAFAFEYEKELYDKIVAYLETF